MNQAQTNLTFQNHILCVLDDQSSKERIEQSLDSNQITVHFSVTIGEAINYQINKLEEGLFFSIIIADHLACIKNEEFKLLGKKNKLILLIDEFDYNEIQLIADSCNLYRFLHKPINKLDFTLTIREIINSSNQLNLIRNLTNTTEQQKFELEILKEQLIQTAKLKRAFLANISHKVRSPLNGIVGFSELLKMENTDCEHMHQYISHISTSALTLLHTVNELLDVSKIESGYLELNYVDFYINDMLQELFDYYKQIVVISNVNLHLDSGLLHYSLCIKHDRLRIKQIISNILDVAIANATGGNIEFGYFFEGRKIVFNVKYTGNKIIKKDIISDEYFLSLSHIQEIINALGGDLIVKTDDNSVESISFSILSLIDNEELINDLLCSEYSNVWNNKRLLVIDDDVADMHYINQILLPTKIEVDFFDGTSNLLMLSENNIDIVLVSVHMKSEDGIFLIRKIRSVNQSIPIIAITSYAMVDDKVKCFEFGATDFITKPINQYELYKMFDKYLKMRSFL